MKRKKVCYIRSTSIINDSRASKEITSLINNGYEVTVFGWDRDSRLSNKNQINLNNNTVATYVFKFQAKYGASFVTLFGLLLFNLWLLFKLNKLIEHFDIIHSCDLDCGYVSSKVASKYNKKFVYDIYDYYSDSRQMPKFLKGLIKNKEDRVIDKSDITIICGEWRKIQLQDSTPKKLIVIHNSPNINYSYFDLVKGEHSKIRVCYVGILQDGRLLLDILKAFTKNPDFELHIGGFGKYEKDFEDASKRYSNIFYYGSLQYDYVLSLESDCDVLFATYDPSITNHQFSAPNKVYESMALGKPVVVCKGTGIDELVANLECGIVVNYDSKDFIRALKNLQHNQFSKFDPEKIRKTFIDNYCWNVMEKRLIEAYAYLD